MKKIPRYWEVIRSGVERTLGTKVFLGGGALRDLDLLGAPDVKDLDLFFECGDADAFFGAQSKLTDLWGHPDEAFNVEQDYRTWSKIVVGAAVWRVEDGPDIQVIGRDIVGMTPHALAETFDYGLCQIVWDGNEIAQTGAYLIDREHKRFTLRYTETPMGLAGSIRRYHRLKGKYPGYDVRVDTKCLVFAPEFT